VKDNAQLDQQGTRVGSRPGTHWLTALSVLLAGFLFALAPLSWIADNDQTTGERIAFAVLFGLAGVVLLGGLWVLRRGGPVPLAYTMVVIGLIGAGMWWWMVLPTLLALVVLVFGVICGGLVRELRTP